MGAMVTVFDPQGNEGEIPAANLSAGVKAGLKPSVKMKAPDGTLGYIPADRTSDAVKAGLTIIPIEDQPAKSFWGEAGKALWQNLSSMPAAAWHAVTDYDPMTDPKLSDADKMKIANQQHDAAVAKNTQREHEHGLAYSVGASANEMIGVNVEGEEEGAREGNPGKVVGTAAAVPISIALTEALAKGGPASLKAAEPHLQHALDAVKEATPKQAAQTIGGVSGAVAGHGTLSAPGAYYGAKTAGKMAEVVLGKERANAPIYTKPAVYPGAPLPQVPPEMAAEMAAKALPEAFQPLPAKAPSVPGTVDAPFQSALRTIESHRAAPDLPAAFQPLPPKAPPVPGTVDAPFPATEPRAPLPNAEPEVATPQTTEKTEAAVSRPIYDRAGRLDLSGESALRDVLTAQDNANLMKIARARGINVSQEAQLKPGVADPRLVDKIVDDFSQDELEELRNTYLETERFAVDKTGKHPSAHNFGDIGAEAHKTLSLQTYFPDVKIPTSVLIRTKAAIARAAQPATPAMGPVSDLGEILKSSAKAAAKTKTKPVAAAAPPEASAAPSVPSVDFETQLQEMLKQVKAGKKLSDLR